MLVGDNIFDTWTTASNNMTKVTGQKGKLMPKKNVQEKIKDCAEVTNSYYYNPSKITKVEKSNSIFVGVDYDAHVGVGGHIRIGFNVPNNFGGIVISSMF